MQRFAVALVIAVMTAVTAAAALAGSNMLDPHALAHARVIKAEVSARYVRQGGPRLAVTEASSTGRHRLVPALDTRFQGLRVVPADNGIYYAICPVRATCPYPSSRAARAASAFTPRRQALELALRTFLETSATVAVVSLPTRDYVFFLVERDELAAAVDMAALARALGGNPARAPAASVRRIVDEITRPRLFVPLGLAPTAGGLAALGVVPLGRSVAEQNVAARGRRARPRLEASWLRLRAELATPSSMLSARLNHLEPSERGYDAIRERELVVAWFSEFKTQPPTRSRTVP